MTFTRRLEAIASRLEAIASRLEAIAIRLEAIAIRLEAIAIGLELITIMLEAIAIRLEAAAIRLEAIAFGLEAIVIRLEAIFPSLLCRLHPPQLETQKSTTQVLTFEGGASVSCQNDPTIRLSHSAAWGTPAGYVYGELYLREAVMSTTNKIA